ncbi:MAG: hypothetical protein EXS35_16650 [Pedosphaera sp.]|nr:hypothetical protein [Pedosphaera sp.]
MGNEASHRAAFERAFGFWDEAKREQVFRGLWDEQAPRHADLVDIACDPREVRTLHKSSPGALCPLCDFPTFGWADAAALTPAITAAISVEFPAWEVSQSLCGRCRKTYVVAVAAAGARQMQLA